MQRLPSIYFSHSPIDGRLGVFTSEAIPAKTLIEICPVIVFSAQDLAVIHQTKLHDYYFLWGLDDSLGAIALGFGSLYNHSYRPNAEYLNNFEDSTLDIYSIKDIAAGEEICFNYNGDEHDDSPLWF